MNQPPLVYLRVSNSAVRPLLPHDPLDVNLESTEPPNETITSHWYAIVKEIDGLNINFLNARYRNGESLHFSIRELRNLPFQNLIQLKKVAHLSFTIPSNNVCSF
jgi:hypothetical protein